MLLRVKEGLNRFTLPAAIRRPWLCGGPERCRPWPPRSPRPGDIGLPLLSFFLAIFLFIGTSCSAMSVWEHAKYTFTDAFDTTGLEILGAGTVLTLVAFSQDQAMHDAWAHNQRMSTDGSAFGSKFWGTGIPQVTIALVQLIFDTENGIVDSEGLASSTIVAQGLKFGTQRQRPDSGSTDSFPSGHTQISFASATSLEVSYGPWVGVPMFALATWTGFARLSDNMHWFSDVTAGATVGVLFGRAGFKHHFAVSPMVVEDGGQGGGLIAAWRL